MVICPATDRDSGPVPKPTFTTPGNNKFYLTQLCDSVRSVGTSANGTAARRESTNILKGAEWQEMSRQRWGVFAALALACPSASAADIELRCLGSYTTVHRPDVSRVVNFRLVVDFQNKTVYVSAAEVEELGPLGVNLTALTEASPTAIAFETTQDSEKSFGLPLPRITGTINRTNGDAAIAIANHAAVLGGRCQPTRPIF